jgi:hypothetical protein
MIEEILTTMTKEELITVIVRKGWPITRFELQHIKWSTRLEALQVEERIHTDKLDTNEAIRQDDLVRQYNKSDSLEEGIEILAKMKPYNDKMLKWIAEDKRLRRKRNKLDRLYEEMKERK